METQTIDKTQLVSALQQFTGTQNYYEHRLGNLKMFMTDGARYLAETAKCYWLIDLILSFQVYPKIRQEPFQVWCLKRLNNEDMLLTCTDGSERVLKIQEIGFSDFPLSSITIWFVESTAMLPTEY